ncbi:MAG: fermentation-respiration switch protein FrsA (DUF1100 family), partial [Saprospiraceae bacterium]
VWILGAIYLLICFFLYWKQESFIFHPTVLPPDYPFSEYGDVEEVFFPIKNGKIHALHFRAPDPKGIILYFHGNSQGLESWGYAAEDFTKLGFEVFMPDYRTYGKSTGKLSEKGLHQDALLVYNYLLDTWPATKIIIYGRSLGTGIGTELATKVKAKLLILETPYRTMPAMANKTIPFVPIKWIIKYQFRNISKMRKLRCPVHIFAGTLDQLTPYQHAVALAKRTQNPAQTLTTIEGAGHNNIGDFPLYHEKLAEILKGLEGRGER